MPDANADPSMAGIRKNKVSAARNFANRRNIQTANAHLLIFSILQNIIASVRKVIFMTMKNALNPRDD